MRYLSGKLALESFKVYKFNHVSGHKKPTENSKRESINAECPDVGRSVRLSEVETVRYIGYRVV